MVGNLANTANVILIITATVDHGTAEQPITNTIIGLTADQPDPNSNNNEGSAVITPNSSIYYIFLPIISKEYEPCRFYDFSFYEGDWRRYYKDAYTIFGYVNGEYRIVAKDSTRTHLAWPTGKYENYRINAKVRWFDASSIGTKYGLVFAIADDRSSFYTFMVYPATQAYEIKYYHGSWDPPLYSGHSSAITTGLSANYLSVERFNGKISIAVNSTPLGSITATQISGKRHVGIGVGPYKKSHRNHNADARFDDFEICPLSAEGVAIEESVISETMSTTSLQGGSVPGDWNSEAH
jgi:hypothetical protein